MSQYTERYLAANGTESGTGKTVGTYLAGVLRGRAKSYAGGYVRALINDLERRVDKGTVVLGPSIRNGQAYYKAK